MLDAAAAADMLAWENSGFPLNRACALRSRFPNCVSIVSLEHLLRYCARPPFALERLSVNRGADGRIARVRYVLPRHFGRRTGSALLVNGLTLAEVPLTGLSLVFEMPGAHQAR